MRTCKQQIATVSCDKYDSKKCDKALRSCIKCTTPCIDKCHHRCQDVIRDCDKHNKKDNGDLNKAEIALCFDSGAKCFFKCQPDCHKQCSTCDTYYELNCGTCTPKDKAARQENIRQAA